MKHAIIIIILIATLLTAAFFEQRFITASFSQLKERVTSFKEVVLLDEDDINNEQNKESINNLISFWEQKEETLFLFLSHMHLEELSTQLYIIKVAVDFNNKEQVLTSTELILAFLKDHSDFAVVSWHSIF